MSEALEKYYKDNYDRLVKSYTRRCGTPWDAEDVVQEAFTRALTYIDRYDTREPIANWITRIVYIAFCAWKNEQKAGPAYVTYSDEDYDPLEGNMERRVLVDRIKSFIDNKYDDKTKEVINLFYFCNYKAREIGELTGLSTSVVLNRLADFRKAAGGVL